MCIRDRLRGAVLGDVVREGDQLVVRRSRAKIRDLRGTRRTGAFVGELLGERTQRRGCLLYTSRCV